MAKLMTRVGRGKYASSNPTETKSTSVINGKSQVKIDEEWTMDEGASMPFYLWLMIYAPNGLSINGDNTSSGQAVANTYRPKIRPDGNTNRYVISIPPITDPSINLEIRLDWMKEPNATFINYWTEMENVIASHKSINNIINYDTIEPLGPNLIGDVIPTGSPCLLRTGELLIKNLGDMSAYIFDIDDFTSYKTVTKPTDFNTSALDGKSILLPDGTVYLLSGINSGYILNPTDLTITKLSNNYDDTTNDTSYIDGGTILPDGNIFAGPDYSITAPSEPLKYRWSLIDTDTGLLERSGNYLYDTGVSSICLMPTGKLIATPGDATSIYGYLIDTEIDIVTPFSNLINLFAIRDPIQYSCGVIISPTEVFCVPSRSSETSISYGLLLDADTMTAGKMSIFAGAFSDGALISDGRILLVPRAFIGINTQAIDPNEDESTGFVFADVRNGTKSSLAIGDNYQLTANGSRILPDGRIVITGSYAHYNQTDNGSGGYTYTKDAEYFGCIISASDGNYGAIPSLETCCSSYLNIH